MKTFDWKLGDLLRGMQVVPVMVTLALVVAAVAMRQGAPLEACVTMLPQHPKVGNSPPMQDPDHSLNNLFVLKASYDVTTHKATITLQGVGANKFKGFLVRAKNAKNPDEYVNGLFTDLALTEGKTIDCDKAAKSAITHSDVSEKTKVTATWTAPPVNMPQSIVFQATVAKEKYAFTNEIRSAQIDIAAPPTVKPVAPSSTSPQPVPTPRSSSPKGLPRVKWILLLFCIIRNI
ncbi:putative ferric-chelate reductase 1 [Ornithodoros turicata]|uniref:putative ferric-chelate reductase 1 n=1 Tax=Ornithodoros turicata TaxID=34597 RepID=UPI00313A47B2